MRKSVKLAMLTIAIVLTMTSLSFGQEKPFAGNPRIIKLTPVADFAVQANARGDVLISHVNPGFHPFFQYKVEMLKCGTLLSGLSLDVRSRKFYAIYLQIGGDPLRRLQSFQPSCGHFDSHQNGVLLRQTEFDEVNLFTQDLVVKVYLETDGDAVDGPDEASPVLVLEGTHTLFP